MDGAQGAAELEENIRYKKNRQGSRHGGFLFY
jgi:hypothetical protein